jgi:hypothetical protein
MYIECLLSPLILSVDQQAEVRRLGTIFPSNTGRLLTLNTSDEQNTRPNRRNLSVIRAGHKAGRRKRRGCGGDGQRCFGCSVINQQGSFPHD